MKDKQTIRVQVEMPSRSHERLKRLRDLTEAASYAEVVNHALKLYEATVDLKQSGGRLFAADKEGTMAEYVVFL